MMRGIARSLNLISKIPKSLNLIISQSHPEPTTFSSRSHLSPLSPSIASIQFINKTRRDFATSVDHNNEIDEINLKFADAREEIDAALESKETVYFDEEAECAREAVNDVLKKFDGLLEKLEEKERMALRRSMGLKMEQLKAELKQLDE